MKCWSLVVLCLCIGIESWGENPRKSHSAQGRAQAEWTIMLYMNGRNNNLEVSALCDFHEMLSTTLSNSISLVVELSLDGNRPTRNGTTTVKCPPRVDVPYWGGTRRFAITNKKTGRKDKPHTGDLGDPRALKEFVKWARKHYPARHYMLDLWSHGEASPALFAARTPGIDGQKELVEPYQLPLTEDKIDKVHTENDGGAISMYKGGTSHILLNSEIREALKKALKSAKLDLIAFDACNKSMIETAFAMSDVGETMVASEERVPHDGWDYNDWLSTLNSDPTLPRAKLGALLVESYKEFYEEKADFTTMASMDLDKLLPVVDQIDRLANLLIAQLIQQPQLRDTIMKAQGETPPYEFQAIDLSFFISNLIMELDKLHYSDKDTLKALRVLEQELLSFIAQPPYASQSSGPRGSKGVAIYFPSSLEKYECDPDYSYYNPDSPKAIPFFKDHCWGRFLKAVLPGPVPESCSASYRKPGMPNSLNNHSANAISQFASLAQ